ncbi:MAG: hypothetical protein ACK5NB_10875 [Flavobacteriaceae bacterium]
MKKIALLLTSVILFMACEGPQGIPGNDGEIIASSAFEIDIDFTSANEHSFIENYGFSVYPTDVTLVYMVWETDNGTEVWRQLPQYREFEDGTNLIYNFDFTQENVRFFLDGTTDFNALGPEWTLNQTFRVVVVPADNVGSLNSNDYNNVIKTLKITAFDKK